MDLTVPLENPLFPSAWFRRLRGPVKFKGVKRFSLTPFFLCLRMLLVQLAPQSNLHDEAQRGDRMKALEGFSEYTALARKCFCRCLTSNKGEIRLFRSSFRAGSFSESFVRDYSKYSLIPFCLRGSRNRSIALASIWRILSRLSLNCLPISRRVSSPSVPIPNRRRRIFSSLGERLLRSL